MSSGSRTAVVMAIIGNAGLTVLKFGSAVISQSPSMMNEAIHSFMDTANQMFLLFGLRAATRGPDQLYAFGHGQKKYLWNLWSAIGLFSIGCGLGLAHAWHSWMRLSDSSGSVLPNGAPVISTGSLWVMGVVLLIALVVEAYVLRVAWLEYLSRLETAERAQPLRHLMQCNDPTLLAVLLEDAIAVTGVILAAVGIILAQALQNPIWDVAFSVVIALMLGAVAIVLGRINMRFLSDVRDVEAENMFSSIVASHREVAHYHDLRSIIIDERNTVLVAEIEVREEVMLAGLREEIDDHEQFFLERVALERQTDPLLREYISDRAAVEATLKRIERLIDALENQLQERCPRVSHVTIEVQGIVEDAREQ
jgi:zinc transporter 9